MQLGSQAIKIRRNNDGKLGYIKDNMDCKTDATVEIKGAEININLEGNEKNPEEFANNILRTFKTDWNVKGTTKAKYCTSNSEEAVVIDCSAIEAKKTPAKQQGVGIKQINKKHKKAKAKA